MSQLKAGPGRPRTIFLLPEEEEEIDIDKVPAVQVRKMYKNLKKKLEDADYFMKNASRCIMCGQLKLQSETAKHFYKNVDILCKSRVPAICKECAAKIAYRMADGGTKKEPTKDSVRQALYYLNRPFLEQVWDNAMLEINNKESLRPPEDVWKAYMHQIQMQNYVHLTYLDSDGLYSIQTQQRLLREEQEDQKKAEAIENMTDDVRNTFMINKKTVIRFLGYDPFENESIEEQPILYAKLVNYFDDSVRDDGLKLEAVIEIVQSFKDVKTINDSISMYKREIGENPAVIATIRSLADTKQKMINSALALAKDNGISVNYNKQSRKGAGTLSGIIKEMNEMNLDDIEINTFDYETSQAMAQVEANSIKNILTQLNPDENDWQREIARQTDMLWKLQDERDKAVEYCRLLRKENKDLKDFLQERGIIDETLQVIDE